MKKLVIFFVAIFAVLISVVIGAYIFRVPILHDAVPLLAHNYGVAIEEINIDSVNVRRMKVPSLVLIYSDQDITAKVSVKNINVEINPWTNVTNALESVQVDSLIVDIEATNYQANTSATNDRIIDWINSIPATLLAVDLLKLNYQLNDDNKIQFAGEVTRELDIAKLSGFIIAPDFPTTNIKLEFTKAGQLDLVLTNAQSEQDIFNAIGAVDINDNWLLFEGTSKLAITNLDKYLTALEKDLPFEVNALQVQFETKLEADLELNLSNVLQSLAAQIDLETNLFLGSEHFKLQQVKLDMRSQCAVQAVQFLECIMRQPLYATFEFTQTPALLQEYVDWREQNYLLEINPADKITASLDMQDETAFHLDGSLQAHMYSQNSKLNLNTKLSDVAFAGGVDSWQLSGNFHSEVDMKELISPVNASRIVAALRGRMRGNEENIQLHVNKGSKVVAQHTSFQDAIAKKVELLQQNDMLLTYVNKSGQWLGENVTYKILPVDLQRKESKLHSSSAEVKINKFMQKGEQLSAKGQIELDQIDITHQDVATVVSNTQVQFDLNNEYLNLDGNVAIGEQKALVEFQLAQDLDEGSGSLTAEMNSFQLTQSATVKQLVAETGLPMQFKTGQVVMNMEAGWEEETLDFPNILLDLKLRDITGDYAQNQFDNLNASIKLQGTKNWHLLEPMQVKIAEVNIGAPITDVSFGFDRVEKLIGSKPTVKLSELSAQMLDGSIYAKDIEIDLNQDVNEFSIYLFDLSLEKLLALNQTEDLIASGNFDGELPIRIQNDKFIVQKGWLRADENGGVIKYNRIEEVLVGNPNLELVADLLKDFRYNEMSAQVDLQPNGELLLATKLHGRSPNAELNKQVNLNFNIEFNLWKFLESARLLTRIDQDISKQILSTQGKK